LVNFRGLGRAVRFILFEGFAPMKVSRFFSFVALVGALVVSAPSILTAAEPNSGRALKPGQFNPANESVDLFEGIKKGEIEVKMMQKDTAQGKLFSCPRRSSA
jgi:hypothetical protein